ncbi:MAG: type II toxin-antitoxin system RelE/ParE family toxin [Defluviicoccus sp.]|nr:type II toxin-antitoxin system RelE/ParE family toxin [Defluviicoccus sp.]MDE0276531.1 type II toxin-antitoxin system RelE/ParE family toxin [Defluviicoccus sp.]
MIDYLADHPAEGDEIPGTGGVRKLRFAALGRGKRGGARVIYFYGGEHMPVYALLAYAKSAKADLSQSERRTVRAVVAALKSAGKEKK